MSRYCQHDYVWGRCPRCEEVELGYVPPPPPPSVSAQLARLHAIYSVVPRNVSRETLPIRLNLDRAGLPRDYATYVWLLYKRVVADDSPARRAFLNGTGGPGDLERFIRNLYLPEADPALMGTVAK